MDILFISQSFPDQEGTGAQRRAWAHLSGLSKLGAIDMLIVTPPIPEEEINRRLSPAKEVARRALALCMEPPYPLVSPSSSALTIIWRALFHNNTRRRRITAHSLDLLQSAQWSKSYAAVFCFRIASYSAWRQITGAMGIATQKVIVDFDDIETTAHFRALRHEHDDLGMIKSLQELIDIAHIRRLENHILRQADDVLICSEKDRRALSKRIGIRARISVLPNTVNLTSKACLPCDAHSDNHEILFLGAMSYPPNTDGACYLVRDILPLLRAASERTIKLSIVGFNPPPQVVALGDIEGIEVTGGVDDTAPYYQRASVALVPLRFGGGTRIKILEAMAYGRPVVSTSLGAEGLDVTDGEDILLADSPEAFAQAVVRLIEDRALCEKLVKNGRLLVEEKYSHEAATRSISALVTGRRGT